MENICYISYALDNFSISSSSWQKIISELILLSKIFYKAFATDLKLLSRANSLIANNNIRSAILEIKNNRCKIVKILIFCSLSQKHFQSKIISFYFENVLGKENEILPF